MDLKAVTARQSARRLVINGASIFCGEAIARLSTFLMALLIARRFGPIALGSYGYAIAVASIVQMLPDMGLQLFAIREISAGRHRLRTIFWNIHWVKLVLAAAVVLLVVAFGQWLPGGESRRVLLYLLTVRVVLQTFSQASMAVFKAFERMQYVAVQQSINTIVTVLWAAAALIAGSGLPVLAAALIAGQAAETLAGWYFIRTKFSPGTPEPWNSRALWTIVAGCLPIGITSILQAIVLRVDVLVLERHLAAAEFGSFQAAAWFAVATFLATSLLMTVLFPKLSRLLRENPERGGAYVLSLLKNGLLITAVGSLAVWLAAPAIVPLFFGRELASAAAVLRVFAPVLPLTFMNTALFFVFIAAGRRFVCVGTLGFGIGAGAVACSLLAARYGPAGGALADLLREFAIGAVYLFFLVQGNHARAAGLALLKVFAAATALLLVAALSSATLRQGETWLAAWTACVPAGILILLGWPRIREWRLLADDAV